VGPKQALERLRNPAEYESKRNGSITELFEEVRKSAAIGITRDLIEFVKSGS
jgi:hypothetical protein